MLLEEETDEIALGILKKVVQQSSWTNCTTECSLESELIPPCLTILRLLVEHNRSCRHRLAQRLFVYSVVVRCLCLCSTSEHSKYEGSSLLVYLLFDEVAATVTADSTNAPFSLSDVLVKRLGSSKYPFL